jgi:DNA repair protein RecO (recombination protein O)
MSNISCPFLVLRVTKYSEADLIVTGLTPDFGKLSLIARGALKSKKRFSGGLLESTHALKVDFIKSKKEGGLGTLSEAQLKEDFAGLRTEYDRLQTALRILGVIDKISQEGDPHAQDLYHLTGHSLKVLQKASDLQIFWSHFVLRLLMHQGILVQESWMKIFLEIPMAQHESLQTALMPQFTLDLERHDVFQRTQRILDQYLDHNSVRN